MASGTAIRHSVNGYFIDDGYDFAETSFHMLTIGGVRGRDTIGAV